MSEEKVQQPYIMGKVRCVQMRAPQGFAEIAEHPADTMLAEMSRHLGASFGTPQDPAWKPPAPKQKPMTLDELSGSGWEKSDCFCVHCGQQTVIVEASEGDVYAGPEFFCQSCQGSFHLA